MGPRGAGHLDGDSLGEGEVLHPHAHNRSLRHRRLSNHAVVVVRPLYKEGEDSIRGDEGGVKCQRPPPDLVLVYLHNTDRIFYYLTFYVKYILRVCTLTRNPAVGIIIIKKIRSERCSWLNARIQKGWNWECRALLID